MSSGTPFLRVQNPLVISIRIKSKGIDCVALVLDKETLVTNRHCFLRKEDCTSLESEVVRCEDILFSPGDTDLVVARVITRKHVKVRYETVYSPDILGRGVARYQQGRAVFPTVKRLSKTSCRFLPIERDIRIKYRDQINDVENDHYSSFLPPGVCRDRAIMGDSGSPILTFDGVLAGMVFGQNTENGGVYFLEGHHIARAVEAAKKKK